VPNPLLANNNKRRVQRLLGIFAAVLVLSSLVIGLTLHSGETLKLQAAKLTDYRIPELREINKLQNAMGNRVNALYLYYATFDSTAWKTQDKQLDTHVNISLGALEQLGLSADDCQKFSILVTEFAHTANLFDLEMNKGDDRDWDKLREHLAKAQVNINNISTLLNEWSDKINSTAQASGITALQQVSYLTQLQLGFSLAVMIISAFVLFALYGRMKDQDELYRRAYFDSATGLPNRLLLEKNIEQLLTTATQGALLVIHVNRLNVIASTYGHIIADQLLNLVARRITSQHADNTHKIYRVTSDSFALIVQAENTSPDTMRQSTHKIAETLVHISTQTFSIGERHLRGDISIGIAEFAPENETATSLLRNAFAAMNAKNVSGNVHWFEARMTAENEYWLSTESALRNALQENEFELHYQPKVDAKTLKATSSEALIRWRNQGTLVSPAHFILVAEESGLIIPIGNWVLLEACRQWRAWKDLHNIALPIAVNISAQQFQDSAFIAQVSKALEQFQVPPAMIELEVTEAVAARDPESAITIMQALKKIGVTLAIDDFGTGYSSLSYLKRFPIDTLKIDIAFVRNIHTSGDDQAIAGMILALGKQLNLKVVAEGVELVEQQELLADLNCDILQGYLFSKPIPSERFASLIINE
jgi:diguanylate cyclase